MDIDVTAWNKLLADIIELTGASEGDIVIEIKRIPHKIWETIDAREHEFSTQEDKFLKEYKPVTNLTVKAFCRCVSHMHLAKKENPSEQETAPIPMTEEERIALEKMFKSFESA